MMADTGVAMPAAQIARAWLQMARSKGHSGIPSKSSFSPLVKGKRRMGSSSDLCGSITEGPTEDAFHVQLERESKTEDWGFVWNQTALSTRRRFLLESVSEGSPAASWNGRECELGRSTLEPGSTLVEANYLAGYGVIRHELRESMQLRLTFLRPAPDPTPTEKRLVGLPPECRVKNSFLEVSPVDADSQEEARHFSDPGPCAQKGCSSSAEGAGVSATESQICGYHTESEAVSDLIGTAALISGLVRSAEFNGKWCRIDAFDPEVRRYIVRVFLEEGQPPVIAKLRLENLSFGPTFALASSATPAFHPFAPPSAAVAEDLSAWPWGQANWPWGIHAGMTGTMEGCMPIGMEADAWQVPAEWASYPFGPPGLPPTEAAVMQSMPPPPATPLCILPTTGQHFAPSDAAAAAPNTAGMAENAGESHERPPQIHTHQVLEQQLIQQHLQVLQQSAAPDVQEAVQPSVSSSQQLLSASSLQQEAEEPQAPHEEDVAEGKKKRRRRRRGKRKGRGSKDAQDAEDDDEESDVAEEPSPGNEADVLTSQSRHASTPQPTEAEVQVQQHAAAETLQAAAPGSPRLDALQTLSTRKPEELLQEESWKPRLDGTACPGEVQPSPTPPAVLLTGELREEGHTSSRDASSQMQEMPEVAVTPGANDALQPASWAKTRGTPGPAATGAWRPSLARSTESPEPLESRPLVQETGRSARADPVAAPEFHESSDMATWQPTLQRRIVQQ
ncbi:udkA [Symbiodinium sp. CCMP2456]|nr:udkA [Symbiodinium sp. CCMP2456]